MLTLLSGVQFATEERLASRPSVQSGQLTKTNWVRALDEQSRAMAALAEEESEISLEASGVAAPTAKSHQKPREKRGQTKPNAAYRTLRRS